MTERHFHNNPNPMITIPIPLRTSNATDSLYVNTAPRFDPANSKIIGEGIITRTAATTTSTSMGRIGYYSSHNTAASLLRPAAAAMPSILSQSATCSAGGLLGGRKAFPSASLNKKKTSAFGFERGDAAAATAFESTGSTAIAAPKILKIGDSGRGGDEKSKIDSNGAVRFAALEKAVLERVAKRRRESSEDDGQQATSSSSRPPRNGGGGSPPRTVRFVSPPRRAQPPPDHQVGGSSRVEEPPQQKRRRYQRRNSKVSHMFFCTPESLGLTEEERECVERDMGCCGPTRGTACGKEEASQQRRGRSASSIQHTLAPPSSHPQEEGPPTVMAPLSARREHTKGRASSLPAGQPADTFLRAAERYHSFPPAQQQPKRTLVVAPQSSSQEDAPQMPLLAQHELLRRMMRAQQERRRALLEMAVAAGDGNGNGGGVLGAAKFLS